MPADPHTPTTPDAEGEPLDRVSVVLLIAVAALLLAKAFMAMQGAFEVDEFALFAGGRDFLADPAWRLRMPHKVLSAAVFAAGAAAGREDPVMGLIVNRWLAVVCNVAVYVLVLRMAGRLFGRHAAIHALVGLGAVFVFIDHSYVARADVLWMTLALAGLEGVLDRRPAALALGGLALGLALLVSLKAALLVGAVVLAWVAGAAVARDARRGAVEAAVLAAGGATPLVLYLVARALLVPDAGAVGEVTAPQVETAVGAATGVPFGFFYLSTLRQNPLFYALAFAGWGWAAARWWRGPRDRNTAVALVAVAASLLGALAYSQPWPYFLATVVPGLAVFWGGLCGAVHRALVRERVGAVHVAAVALLLVVGVARPADRVRYNLSMDNTYQVLVIDRLREVTAPGERVLDGVGLRLDQGADELLWLDVVRLQQLRADDERSQALLRELADGHTAAIVVDWRTEQLPRAFGEFRDRYFVQDWGNVYTPGRAYDSGTVVGTEVELPVITGGTYHLRTDPSLRGQEPWRTVTVDGRPMTGPTVELEPGTHGVLFRADLGTVRLQRYADGFVETRAPLDGYKPLFPKERYLMAR